MTKVTGWAAWHPTKGFDRFTFEGPIVFADLDERLLEDIRSNNEDDGTTNKTGWRAVKVEVALVP